VHRRSEPRPAVGALRLDFPRLCRCSSVLCSVSQRGDQRRDASDPQVELPEKPRRLTYSTSETAEPTVRKRQSKCVRRCDGPTCGCGCSLCNTDADAVAGNALPTVAHPVSQHRRRGPASTRSPLSKAAGAAHSLARSQPRGGIERELRRSRRPMIAETRARSADSHDSGRGRGAAGALRLTQVRHRMRDQLPRPQLRSVQDHLQHGRRRAHGRDRVS